MTRLLQNIVRSIPGRVGFTLTLDGLVDQINYQLIKTLEDNRQRVELGLSDGTRDLTVNSVTANHFYGLADLQILDLGTSYYLKLVSDSTANFTADRTLTFDLANASRLLTISGDSAINQSLLTTVGPTFDHLHITAGNSVYADHIDEVTATHGVVCDGVQLKDGGALAIVGGANTFDIVNGTAHVNLAASSYLDVNANLTVETASIVNQDLTSDTSPTFVGLTLSGAIATPTSITLDNGATDGGKVNFNGGVLSYLQSSADGATLNGRGFTLYWLGSETASYPSFVLQTSTGDATGPLIEFDKTRGTMASPTAVSNGDTLGSISWRPRDTDSWTANPSGMIKALVNGTVTATTVPTDLVFYTGLGDVAPTEKMRIYSDGSIGMSETAPATAATPYILGVDNIGIGQINEIWENSTNGVGTLYLNYRGYQGGVTQFRDTHICDGKKANIATFKGSTGLANFVTGITLQNGSTLSNYVEGTWTPVVTLVGGTGNVVPTYITYEGRYTKIGRLCFFEVTLLGDGGTAGAGTGTIRISLPLTGSASVTKMEIMGYGINGTTEYNITGTSHISTSATTVLLAYWSAATVTTAITGAGQNNASRSLRLTGFYEI